MIFVKTLFCTLIVIIGVIFAGINILKLEGASAYANGSVQGLQKLERAVSNIRSFRQENGRYPTNVEINCTNYKAIKFGNEICIQTISLQASEDEDHFVVIYKSLGRPFSGKTGAGIKREFTYTTETKSFNFSHLDTYREVIIWRISHIFIGIMLVFLPIVYLRRRSS